MMFRRWLHALASQLHRRPRKSARKPRAAKPRLEALEDRCVPKTITVTSTADGPGLLTPGSAPGTYNDTTLRGAINAVNIDTTTAYPDTIAFNISPSDPGYNSAAGVWVLSPLSQEPILTHPAIVNGIPQTLMPPNHPVIVLDGNQAGVGANGLDFNLSAAYLGNPSYTLTVQGLDIVRWKGAGLLFESGQTGAIDNIVGLDPTGTTAFAPNGASYGNATGVRLTTVGGAVLGGYNIVYGTAVQTPNIISGNVVGIDVASSSDSVIANYVGTDISGTKIVDPNGQPLGNQTGILVETSVSAVSIGMVPGDPYAQAEYNVIAGNLKDGIDLNGVTGHYHEMVFGVLIVNIGIGRSRPDPSSRGGRDYQPTIAQPRHPALLRIDPIDQRQQRLLAPERFQQHDQRFRRAVQLTGPVEERPPQRLHLGALPTLR